MEAAVYVADMLDMTGHGYMPLLPASSVLDSQGEFAPPPFCENLLITGAPQQNLAAAALLKPRASSTFKYIPPVAMADVAGGSTLSLGKCSWTDEHVAALALLPWWRGAPGK